MKKKITEAVEWFRKERRVEEGGIEDAVETEKEREEEERKRYGRWRPSERRKKGMINNKKKNE